MSRGESDLLERQLEARDPDVRLMLQVKDDVPTAFEVLVLRYQDRLVGVLYYLVGNQEEAEDLAQDTFLRIYKSRKGYRPRAKFSTWLFAIANNLALNSLRRRASSSPSPTTRSEDSSSMLHPQLGRLHARESTASSHMLKIELSTVVQEAIKTLGEDQKMAIFLSKFENMSYGEIAGVMDRSPAAIKSLLARARNELRERLEPYVGCLDVRVEEKDET